MPSHESLEAQNKDAWSADTHEIDHPDNDSDHHTERGGNQEEDEYHLLHGTDTDEGRHPGQPVGWGGQQRYDEDTSYRGQYDDPRQTVQDLHASALSPGGYEDYRRSASAGYTFSRGDDHR